MSWNNIILEAFCMYDVSKDKYTEYQRIKINDNKIIRVGKPRKDKNRLYSPDLKRPKWCIKKFGNKERCPEFKCLMCGCKYLAYNQADKKDRDKAIRAMFQ